MHEKIVFLIKKIMDNTNYTSTYKPLFEGRILNILYLHLPSEAVADRRTVY